MRSGGDFKLEAAEGLEDETLGLGQVEAGLRDLMQFAAQGYQIKTEFVGQQLLPRVGSRHAHHAPWHAFPARVTRACCLGTFDTKKPLPSAFPPTRRGSLSLLAGSNC
ncbi:hypothetical protein GCM10012320_04610 [Sinomonas cellulolyticus]|nr:hypothetical protein GCM10012320_04610 [Sinomonas sp. KCTC 49339]